MGNQQMQGMMSPDQMKLAKIKAIIEEIEVTENQVVSTHGLSKVAEHKHEEHDHEEHDHEDETTSVTETPETAPPAPNRYDKTEFELFQEIFEKQYLTSTFKVVEGPEGGATEITLSKVDFAGVLARQVAMVDEKLHRDLTYRLKLRTKYEALLAELVPA